MWDGLHCESVVFPDHTACMDPGNIVGGRGVQVGLPQVFLVLNLIFKSPMCSFERKYNFQDSNIFQGGGESGVQLFPGWGSNCLFPIRTHKNL